MHVEHHSTAARGRTVPGPGRHARRGRRHVTRASGRRLRYRLTAVAGAAFVTGGLALAVVGSQAGASGPVLATTPSQSSILLGQRVTDSATVTMPGFSSGLMPVMIQFFTCGPFTSVPAQQQCGSKGASAAGLTPLGGAIQMNVSGNGKELTATSASFPPTQTGVYCFGAAIYAMGQIRFRARYQTWPATGDECFTVTDGVPTPVPSDRMTAQVSSTSMPVGSSVTDSATVYGNLGGTPSGSVDFTVCGPTAAPAACASGSSDAHGAGTQNLGGGASSGSESAVRARQAHAAGSGSATAVSAPYTPTATGTYCFLAAYGGSAVYHATTVSDPTSQCITITAAPVTTPGTLVDPGFTTSLLTPSSVTVGTFALDSAVLTGSDGAPSGTVTFSACAETTAGVPCSGGTVLATLTSPTTSSTGRSVYDLPAADALHPSSTGTWCFSAVYGGDHTYAPLAAESDPASECFAVAPASTPSTPPVVAAAGSSSGAPIADATTAHTGEWWAGATPLVLIVAGGGLLLLAAGDRRSVLRQAAAARRD